MLSGTSLCRCADLVVIEIVSGGDFHAACAEFGIDISVGDHGNAVVRIMAGVRGGRSGAGNARHPDARRPPRRQAWFRDGWWRRSVLLFLLIQTSARIFERIENMPEKSVFLRRYHFQIGDSGLQHRIPVHQSLAAVDQAFVDKAARKLR